MQIRKLSNISSKQELRRSLLEWRRTIPHPLREAACKSILQRLTALPEYLKADKLLIYVSNDEELDTRLLLSRALSEGRVVCCPRCIKGTNDMVFCLVRSLDDLRPGSFGLLEPDAACEAENFTSASLCITPALAYDHQGYRIGYGRGYYDKFFGSFPGVKLGLCFEEFLLDDVFRDEHDVPVDVIMTEKNIVYPHN